MTQAKTKEKDAQVAVAKDGGPTFGPRDRINFVTGAGITFAITDDPLNNEVDVLVSAPGSGGPAVGQGSWAVAFFRQTQAADPADVAPVDTGVAYDRQYEWQFASQAFASNVVINVGDAVGTFWTLVANGGFQGGARPFHIAAAVTFDSSLGLYLPGWLDPVNTGVGFTDQPMLAGSGGNVDIYLDPTANHFTTFNNGGVKAKTIIIKRKLISP